MLLGISHVVVKQWKKEGEILMWR